MEQLKKRLHEKIEIRVKEMLNDCGYDDEKIKVFKEGAKAGAKLMQELLQEICEETLEDAGYADLLKKWKEEKECEN